MDAPDHGTLGTLNGVSAHATSRTDHFNPRHTTGKHARILDPLAESGHRLPVGDFRLDSRWLLDDKDLAAGPGSGRRLTGDRLGESERPNHPDAGVHWHFQVDREFRGQGIGRKLLQRFTDDALASDFAMIWAEVMAYPQKPPDYFE